MAVRVRRRWLAAGFVLAVAAAALLAGLALAGSDATIEATQFRVPQNDNAQASARCPGNQRALGGGEVQSGPPRGELFVQASGPLDASGVTANTRDGDKAKRWYAAVYSGTERNVKVFAICSAASKATIEATEFKVPGRGTAEGFARCPGNKRALGGGVVQVGSPDELFVHTSGPLDASGATANTRDGDKAKQWYAAVENNSNEERDVKVFAICSAASKATIEATQFKVPPRTSGVEAFARCPGNKRALGGGVVQNAPPPSPVGLYTLASGPLDASGRTANTRDGDKAKLWYAAVTNASTAERTFKVFAICE